MKQLLHTFCLFTLALPILLWTGPAPAASPSLADRLERAVGAALPWDDALVEIRDVRVVGELPDTDYELEVETQRFRRRVRARVVSREGVSNTWVQARASITVPVVVVAREIASGEPVESSVNVEMRQLTKLPHGFLSDPDEVADKVARRTLSAGSVLVGNQLVRPVVVERRQLVRIHVQRGSVRVTDRGVALQSGRVGESIRVRSNSSDVVLSAVVRSDGSVEVP